MTNMDRFLDRSSEFAGRHIGPREKDVDVMLRHLECSSLSTFIDNTIPETIKDFSPIGVGPGLSEDSALEALKELANKNQLRRSYIGCGYYGTYTPPPIKRHILENPGWYTQYTPYQAEIAQGRLEALLNFQTICSELTGLAVSNASLLDEATAAAEAMVMSSGIANRKGDKLFLVDKECHPQTIGLLKTRANGLGIELEVIDVLNYDYDRSIFGLLVQYPNTRGEVKDYTHAIETVKNQQGIISFACDLLALTKLKPPAELGADVAFGSSQRFGVPMGYGGPHAAFFSTIEKYKRKIPGRIIGVSKDKNDKTALRLALQTREQHIRREKATSNICTAQALLASMAGMYATYHGPKGLKAIADRIHILTTLLANQLKATGSKVVTKLFFDTIEINVSSDEKKKIVSRSDELGINLRLDVNESILISLDETVMAKDVLDIVYVVSGSKLSEEELSASFNKTEELILSSVFSRTSDFMQQKIFNCYHSETEILRYIKKLESRDLSLTTSMIPLGSCTMKLNAASELIPLSWPEFANMHPFAPRKQTEGYTEMLDQLSSMLALVTGFDAVSLQPNSGAQGEYAGLLVIRKYHDARGDSHRDVCLIPKSAHGTNPASAAMAGMQIVLVDCDLEGNIDIEDFENKVKAHSERLACLMVTYPSTHGVFEESIRKLCDLVHEHGGQVYMDGANLNAQLGLCKPGKFGADVAHLNLHKTFAIPHGGGGPGMGPIAVGEHLKSYLPTHPLVDTGGNDGVGNISAAPFGSALVLTISWMYIKMMGDEGLVNATKIAILSANYIAKRLEESYPVLYKGKNGHVAHECIIDLRQFKKEAGIDVEDVAKRLIDYGFHAPTISFPVGGTMMIEPTESEPLAEVDRFCEAMISIKKEISEIVDGSYEKDNNPLTNAPHTAEMCTRDSWDYPYSREKASYPANWLREHKFWAPVARVDNAYGDRNLICSCAPLEAYI